MDASFYPCNQPPLDQAHTKGRFKDHVVVVTGGASGIGFAVAHRFCNDGATVAILDFNKELAEAAVSHLKSEGIGERVTYYYADVTQKSLCCEAAGQVAADNGGRINHLVNVAAYFGSKGMDADQDDWRRSFDVNVAGYSNMAQACVPYMSQDGTSSIVNIGSSGAKRATPNRWTYSATKGAIKSLSKCMALDLSKRKIRVNNVSPSWIWSPEQAKMAPGGDRWKMMPSISSFMMLGRDGETSEVAAVVAFLCSKDASFITGSDVIVDGGYLAMGHERHGTGSALFAGGDK